MGRSATRMGGRSQSGRGANVNYDVDQAGTRLIEIMRTSWAIPWEDR